MDKDDNTKPMVYPAEGTIMGYGDRYPLDIDGRAVKAQIRYLTYFVCQCGSDRCGEL